MCLPGKERMIFSESHYLCLQTKKSLLFLAIDQWHIDTKKSHQTISLIFNSGRLSSGSPRHLSRNTVSKGIIAGQDFFVDTRSLSYQSSILGLFAHLEPSGIKEDNVRWSDQFLQGPTSSKPSARIESMLSLIRS
ncbi:MAG: hypothetical protein Q9183_001654 [Haloplaca sp. 2 TL-2023]